MKVRIAGSFFLDPHFQFTPRTGSPQNQFEPSRRDAHVHPTGSNDPFVAIAEICERPQLVPNLIPPAKSLRQSLSVF